MLLAFEINSELAALIAFAAAVSCAFWALLTDRRRTEIIAAQEKLYEIKKEELAVSEAARDRERRECTNEISRLEARVSTLESNWMHSLTQGVAEGVLKYLKERQDNGTGS
jgi:hypothetical protein